MNPPDIDAAKYELRKVAELTNWEDNPRAITEAEFSRLKEHIKRLGVYKPLLINQNNIVLGGNMRVRALRELGVDEVMCSIVLTDNTHQMIEYALSDNDEMGVTDQQKLAELITINPIQTAIFAIQVSKLKPIDDLLKDFSPSSEEDQGKLDQVNTMTCPECGHEGKPSEFKTAMV